MAIDMKNFEQQILNLEKMRDAIQGAIDRAKDRLDQIQNQNKSFKEVFETDRKP